MADISSENPSASAIEASSPWPCPSSTAIQAADIAMLATIDRSMPRPMMTTAMPAPRIPSTETLRSRLNRFPAVKNPFRKIANTENGKTVTARTMLP